MTSSDSRRQVDRHTAKIGQVVEVFSNNGKLFGFLEAWTATEITVCVHRARGKSVTWPASKVNVAYTL